MSKHHSIYDLQKPIACPGIRLGHIVGTVDLPDVEGTYATFVALVERVSSLQDGLAHLGHRRFSVHFVSFRDSGYNQGWYSHAGRYDLTQQEALGLLIERAKRSAGWE